MASSPLNRLYDANSNCHSILANVDIDEYLKLVDNAYKLQGGIVGQRAPIRSKTGLIIRKRLVSDLILGAVIPPVVIGIVPGQRDLAELKQCKSAEALVRLLTKRQISLTIIDGMQRTTALLEARAHSNKLAPVRVEFWIAENVQSLIYRMLVLNAGQVPWDLKRQLDTLYRHLVDHIQSELPDLRIISLDENGRRTQAGEFQSTRLVELFLAFTSRTTSVDLREKVAEEFARIDLAEATSHASFFPLFIESLRLMGELDTAFSRAGKLPLLNENGKIKLGKDIFSSLPACLGFIVAIAELVFGPSGFSYAMPEVSVRMDQVKINLNRFTAHLNGLKVNDLKDFIDVHSLNDRLGSHPSSRIGEYERNLYRTAFTSLITYTERVIGQGSLAPCWSAR